MMPCLWEMDSLRRLAGRVRSRPGACSDAHAQFPPIYTAGAEAAIEVTLEETASLQITAAGVEVTLPEGWTFIELSGDDPPNIQPQPGVGGTLEFAWFSTPDYPQPPYAFTYSVLVPAEETAESVEIAALGLYRYLGGDGEYRTETVAAALYAPVPHTWYVDAANIEAGDGSEENPFQALPDALAQCVAGRFRHRIRRLGRLYRRARARGHNIDRAGRRTPYEYLASARGEAGGPHPRLGRWRGPARFCIRRAAIRPCWPRAPRTSAIASSPMHASAWTRPARSAP